MLFDGLVPLLLLIALLGYLVNNVRIELQQSVS